MSTQNTCHPKADVSADDQKHPSIKYNINSPTFSQNSESDAETSNTETRGSTQEKKGHIAPDKIIKSICTVKFQFQKKM